jgi:hypothetical protein
MENKAMFRLILRICAMAMTLLLLGGCATPVREKPKAAFVPTDQGTVVYEDKYEFKAPLGWKVLRAGSGGDFEFGFFKPEGEYPSQTTFAYDDEPYGNSRVLEARANQYQTLFLMTTGLILTESKIEKAEVTGLPAVILQIEGVNPSQNEKGKSKIYLVRRGEWVVSFLCTQWRPMKGTYDPKDFEIFDTFVKSFKFLKKTFWEEIEERIKRLEG